jgi:hypothetical protein
VHDLDRVHEQVDEDLVQQVGIRADVSAVAVAAQLDAGALELRLEELRDARARRRSRTRSMRGSRRRAKSSRLRTMSVMRSIWSVMMRRLRCVGFVGAASQHLGAAADHVERRGDLVAEARGEVADDGELLGLAQPPASTMRSSASRSTSRGRARAGPPSG